MTATSGAHGRDKATDQFLVKADAAVFLAPAKLTAKLSPTWAKDNGIRVGSIKGTTFYSVNDLKAHADRIVAERESRALEGNEVGFWRTVVNAAIARKHQGGEDFAQKELAAAIRDSSSSVITADDLKFD